LTRETQLNDNILRCLFVKIDARIADALISHATAGPQVAKPAAPAPTPSVPIEALDPEVQEAIEA
jgi:hypothetical protein